jgi:hypothetical protein
VSVRPALPHHACPLAARRPERAALRLLHARRATRRGPSATFTSASQTYGTANGASSLRSRHSPDPRASGPSMPPREEHGRRGHRARRGAVERLLLPIAGGRAGGERLDRRRSRTLPDRLVAFCSLNPLHDSALAELDRCATNPASKASSCTSRNRPSTSSTRHTWRKCGSRIRVREPSRPRDPHPHCRNADPPYGARLRQVWPQFWRGCR